MSIVQILTEKGKTEGGIAQLFGRAGITAEDFTCNMLKTYQGLANLHFRLQQFEECLLE